MPAVIDEGKTIAEGTTRRIVEVPRGDDLERCSKCRRVLVISKDDITAGDGKARENFAGKAKSANTTTSNVFKLLKLMGVPTHFLKWHDDISFFALQAEMIPLKVMVRRIATDSYLKRNPETKEGQRFRTLKYELFYRDDARHDPLVRFDSPWYDCFNLYEAGKPVSNESKIELLDMWPLLRSVDYDQMRVIALQVFLILEEVWKELGIMLYNMKIEFGLVPDGREGMRLVVADVIDNGSWCIRDGEGKQLDKQVFRDAVERGVIKAKLDDVSERHELVAKLSESFCDIGRKKLSAR